MPWLLPKLQLLMATLRTFKATTRKNPTALTFRDVDELSAQMKVDPGRSETDDFLLDLVVVALFRFINRYLADYIIVWLTTPNEKEQPDLNSLSAFNIGIFSYIFARMLFVISVRLRRIYELITQYRGQYNIKVLNQIKFYVDHIVDNIEELNLLPQPPGSIDPPISTITPIPPSNFITPNQIDEIVSGEKDTDKRRNDKRAYEDRYKWFQTKFDVINAKIAAANINLSGFKSRQKEVRDLYNDTQTTLNRFITFCWEKTKINSASHIQQVQSFQDSVHTTIRQIKDMMTAAPPTLSIVHPNTVPIPPSPSLSPTPSTTTGSSPSPSPGSSPSPSPGSSPSPSPGSSPSPPPGSSPSPPPGSSTATPPPPTSESSTTTGSSTPNTFGSRILNALPTIFSKSTK
jgi:hypothetical protein